MSLKMRKVLDYGTADPLVARVSFQWIEILDWFDLPESRRQSVLEMLTLNLQPKLLYCRTTLRRLKRLLFTNGFDDPQTRIAYAPWGDACGCFVQLHLACIDFCQALQVILELKATQCTSEDLLQWAQRTLGPHDPVTQYMARLHTHWNSPLREIQSLLRPPFIPTHTPHCPSPDAKRPNPPPSELVALAINRLDSLAEGLVPLIEDGVFAALTQVPLRAPVTFAEIPEAERNQTAPVRFRAMAKGANGTDVPAGRFSQAGNLVPELQRVLQQGLGKPIIAMKHMGQWFIASGSRLYHSAEWNTFHDFLGYYIKDVLAGPWANEELAKPREVRHPLMCWYEDVVRYTNAHLERGENVPMTSLPAAYLGLAYNLYLISHNNGKVHELLIQRLKNKDQFYGAYFETGVAGIMLRAGFDIALEDETDSASSHCEFTASHRSSGQRFSVEAKIRTSTKQPPDLGRQLYKALRKVAKHPRLVFIEVNDDQCDVGAQEGLLRGILMGIRRRESTLTIDGLPAPAAYLVVMNDPPGTVDRPHSPAFMVEGFKIPDFRVEAIHRSFREALDARARHQGVFALIEALRTYTRIPVTFDGDTVGMAGQPPSTRLIIGNPYTVPTAEGGITGTLVHACVLPARRMAACCLRDAAGKDHLVRMALTEQEMEAYHESPRTFFGREEPPRAIDDPLKLYDWIYASYRHNSKEHLLGLLSQMGARDLEELTALPQERLAEVYAEPTAESIAIQTGLLRPVKSATSEDSVECSVSRVGESQGRQPNRKSQANGV